jgi:hypothetical protein
MALTPQEQAELDELELRALESQAAAYEASQAELSGSKVDRSRMGVVPPPQPQAPMTAGEQAIDTAKSMAIQGGAAATGQMLGAATGLGAPVMVPLFGGIGGGVGYIADQMRRDQPITPGGLMSSVAVSTIPGGSAVKGGRALLGESMKMGGLNLMAKNAETLLDEGRFSSPGEAALAFFGGAGGEIVSNRAGKLLGAGNPTAKKTEQEILNAGRDSTLRALRREGFVVAPHTVERGSDVFSSIGGKAAIQQTAAKKNQVVWQRMAAEDLGIVDPKTGKGAAIPIYDETLENVRKRAAAPYERIQEIQKTAEARLKGLRKDLQQFAGGDPMQAKVLDSNFSSAQDNLAIRAGADVEQLKLTRAKAYDAFKAWRGGDPAAYTTWRGEITKANALEDTIDAAAKQLGDKKLLSDLRKSRRLIAKTYAVQEAINPTSGMVDPVVIGRMRDARVPLDGKLKLIGDAQLVFNKEAVEAARVPSPGVDNMSTKFALSSAAHGSPVGTLAAIAQGTIGRIPRGYYFRDSIQDMIASPRTKANVLPNVLTALGRFGTMAAGRDNPFLYSGEDPRQR